MSEDKLPEEKQPGEPPMFQQIGAMGSVGEGAGLVLVWHLLVQIPLAVLTIGLSLTFLCVSQAVYVVPAFISARRRGHEDTAKGIILAASLTALLNIACTGFVFNPFGFL